MNIDTLYFIDASIYGNNNVNKLITKWIELMLCQYLVEEKKYHC